MVPLLSFSTVVWFGGRELELPGLRLRLAWGDLGPPSRELGVGGAGQYTREGNLEVMLGKAVPPWAPLLICGRSVAARFAWS